MRSRGFVEETIAKKEEIKETLSRKVNVKKVVKDHHAIRKPRPCGITVHTAIGCVGACTYCYISDMGFSKGRAEPYPLNGEELVAALVHNDRFFPGIYGTPIALGSVTDPLSRVSLSKTLDYLSAIYEYLGNPVQFSTKF